MSDNHGTRINKYLSEIGYCSRREGDKLIEKGRVTINGKVPPIGTKVNRGDKVAVDGHLVSTPEEDFVYLAYNKPVGVVCTTDSGEKDNIVNHVNYPKRIFPIGRLDKPSEGLIFLTNDGDIVNKILRAGNQHQKEYHVTVDKPITADFIQKMSSGIPILGTMTRKCEVEKLSKSSFFIILTQGLNRQIRRMCEYLGYNVLKLKRVRIMNVRLDVAVGQWRELSQDEMSEIHQMVSDSSKTAPVKEEKIPSTPKSKKPKKKTSPSDGKFSGNKKKTGPSGKKRIGKSKPPSSKPKRKKFR